MNRSLRTATLAIVGLVFARTLPVLAQAIPAATQDLRIEAFGGITGTYTGLNSGKNAGITAGVDFGLRPRFSLYPSLEVRGTYPIDKGSIDSQKNILGGLKLEKPMGHRFHPYADFLFGRGQINYGVGYAIPASGFYSTQSVSNVLSPGAGVDFRLMDRFFLKADAQFQRYSTPVTPSGHLYAKPFTFGLVYSFDFNRHPYR